MNLFLTTPSHILGEANVYDNRDKYDCTFSQLISEWRRVWSSTSTTNKNFPFGFVQLSTIEANDEQTGTPMIRWYQTYKYGYTPNDALQVFLLKKFFWIYESILKLISIHTECLHGSIT